MGPEEKKGEVVDCDNEGGRPEKEEVRAFPTRAGTDYCYDIEMLHDDGEWRPIKRKRVDSIDNVGFPSPTCGGGVYSTIFMMGHAQALAMAWKLKSQAAALAKYTPIKLRLVPYEVKYTIKAYRQDDMIEGVV